MGFINSTKGIDITIRLCKPYYFRPTIWGLKGASYFREHHTEWTKEHIKPIEKIWFRWLFIYIRFDLDLSRETHPIPSMERPTKEIE